jgi:hypothetical protein
MLPVRVVARLFLPRVLSLKRECGESGQLSERVLREEDLLGLESSGEDVGLESLGYSEILRCLKGLKSKGEEGLLEEEMG